jgi:hypothetical protein
LPVVVTLSGVSLMSVEESRYGLCAYCRSRPHVVVDMIWRQVEELNARRPAEEDPDEPWLRWFEQHVDLRDLIAAEGEPYAERMVRQREYYLTKIKELHADPQAARRGYWTKKPTREKGGVVPPWMRP